MPSLKDLRLRIKTVKSTQKITSAMKMVAAAKLRKAQEKAEASRAYAQGMHHLVGRVAHDQEQEPNLPKLLTGNSTCNTHLIVVATSDRGLCGGFNGNIIKEARQQIRKSLNEGSSVKIFCLGRKAKELLRRDYGKFIIGTEVDLAKRGINFANSALIAAQLTDLLEKQEIGKITAVYSTFKSIINQQVTTQNLVPLLVSKETDAIIYEYEPCGAQLLAELLAKNFATQLFQILLETSASEHGARMTAMDNATRNARDVIAKLELNYNRTRQAVITKELIEIISGAEAV